MILNNSQDAAKYYTFSFLPEETYKFYSHCILTPAKIPLSQYTSLYDIDNFLK